jgi:glyoxylase-like metal-dependent hydrolase (beta-lactamase superfamily II)
MVRITDSLFFIPGQDEMIPDAHVYLIGKPGSGEASLVDAGLMGKGNYKLSALAEAGFKPSDIKRVIMTHTHLDHIGCLREILDAAPSAELWMHAAEAAPIEAGDERTVYGMEMFKEMCQSQYRLKDGAFTFNVHRRLDDAEELSLAGEVWTVLHIPGHSPGGIALYDSTRGILIPGDVIYADYAIGRFDLHGASARTLKESLSKLSGLKVKMLLPGHNRVLMDAPDGYVRAVANQWAPYLA